MVDFIRLHEERYVFVAARRLLQRTPLARAGDAAHHTLLDTSDELPLFRYFREAPRGFDSLAFARVVRLGSIAAILQRVLAGHGVAVLPEYFVRRDLRSRRLVRIMPRVKPAADAFRLIFRVDDPQRALYTRLAEVMRSAPLS
jgi:DNA-binding transcriptional LysR family regulator